VSALASTSKGAKATIKAPHQINLSATWEVTPSWRLSGLIHWSDWSSFKSLDISSDNALLPYKLGTSKISIANNWKDSWLFSVGTDYRFNDSVTVRGGIAYEKSPVRDNYRLAIIPDLDRMWFTIGATWHVTKQLQGDFGFAWIHGIGNKSLYSNDDPSKEIGKFRKCESYLFGAQMVYKF
jgi:long-chain fatty acid transport protein